MQQVEKGMLLLRRESMSSTEFSVAATIHPNLKQLSHSSDVTLHRCPRKYELYKLTPSVRSADGEGDEHLDFGSIVGIGVQDILINNSLNQAYMTMFKNWKNVLDSEDGAKSRKTFWHALFAIDKFYLAKKTFLSQYELAYIEGKPTVELGFSIDLGDGFFYRGFIDGVLVNHMRQEIVVLENKTTKSSVVNEAVYKHSGQGLGYSIVLDVIADLLMIALKSSYKVIYLVYKTFACEWEQINFIKNHTERALWMKNILIDKKHIIQYATDGHFPMHGESCYDFFRQCPFFDTCTLNNRFIVGEYEKIEERKEPPEKYQFHFKLEELIESQLRLSEKELGVLS